LQAYASTHSFEALLLAPTRLPIGTRTTKAILPFNGLL